MVHLVRPSPASSPWGCKEETPQRETFTQWEALQEHGGVCGLCKQLSEPRRGKLAENVPEEGCFFVKVGRKGPSNEGHFSQGKEELGVRR